MVLRCVPPLIAVLLSVSSWGSLLDPPRYFRPQISVWSLDSGAQRTNRVPSALSACKLAPVTRLILNRVTRLGADVRGRRHTSNGKHQLDFLEVLSCIGDQATEVITCFLLLKNRKYQLLFLYQERMFCYVPALWGVKLCSTNISWWTLIFRLNRVFSYN